MQKEKEKEKARVQPQRNKRRVLRDETDFENDVDTLWCVVVFAEGGGTVYVQASTTSLLPRRTMLS